jgi:hypothetical protein
METEYIKDVNIRGYFKSVFDYINRPPKETRQLFGKTNLKHRWYFTSTQFALPTEKNYNQLFKNINKSNEWIYSIYRVKVIVNISNLKNQKK